MYRVRSTLSRPMPSSSLGSPGAGASRWQQAPLMPRFWWLTYRKAGRLVGVVIVVMTAVRGIDDGAHFAEGHELVAHGWLGAFFEVPFGMIRADRPAAAADTREVGRFSPSTTAQEVGMAAIERDSIHSGPFHDFKWHRRHRCRRSGQLVDVVMLLGWAALVGWVLFQQ
jgi:hypothetical protein